MDRKQATALDRHITGNYGEDQFRKSTPEGDEVTAEFLPEEHEGHDITPVYRETNYHKGWVEDGRVQVGKNIETIVEEFHITCDTCDRDFAYDGELEHLI